MELRTWLPALLAVAAGAVLCAAGEPPLPALVGLPLVLAGAAWALLPPPEPLRRLGARLGTPWLSSGLSLAFLVGLVCLSYRPLLAGHMPWAAGQADHPTHLFQAWLFVERLLPSGRLTGWSDLRWAGYPALELYPIGGVLWVALFRLLTFGALDWEATYALAILGMLCLNVVATYLATRRFAGPLAAAIAALLVLFERGWPRQGGDHYAVDVGVWPVTLGLGPLLLSLERLWSWIRSRGGARSGRALAASAALAAFALLAHPLYFPVLALAVPTLALVAALSGERGSRAALGPVVTWLVALGLVAFWYVPFFASRELSEPGGAPFRSLGNLGEGLVMGSMLPAFWPLAAAAGLIGVLVALRRGGAPAVPAALCVVLLLAASATPLELSDRLVRFAGNLQQERFLIVVRVLFCVLAGYSVSVLVAAARAGRSRPRSPLRSRLAAALSVGLVGPFAWPVVEGVLKHQVSPIVELEHGPDLEHRRDLLALCRWMRDQAQGESPPPRTVWRVAHGHHEYASAPVYCGLAQLVDTPAETWASRPGGISEREVRALGVRWVVADGPIEGRESYLEPVRAFGRLRVYEVRDYRYDRLTVLGSARAELVHFEDELVRVRVTGSRPGDRLVVHVGQHPAWRATLDGEPLPIRGGHLGLPRADLVHVPVRDGLLELRFVRDGPYLWGAAGTLLAALLLGLVGLSGRLWPALARRPAVGRVLAAAARLPAPARAAAGVVLVGLALAVPVVASGGRARPVGPGRASGELLADRSSAAQVRLESGGRAERVPRRWDGGFGSLLPPRTVVGVHVEALELGDPRRVLAVRLLEGETARLRFDVGPVRGVRGELARGGRGRVATRLEVLVGGESAGRVESEQLGRWTAVDCRVAAAAAPLELVVGLDGAPGRAVLLDLAILR